MCRNISETQRRKQRQHSLFVTHLLYSYPVNFSNINLPVSSREKRRWLLLSESDSRKSSVKIMSYNPISQDFLAVGLTRHILQLAYPSGLIFPRKCSLRQFHLDVSSSFRCNISPARIFPGKIAINLSICLDCSLAKRK